MSELIFGLGTNNWQSEDEPAPGSGILHESHHDTFNRMPNVKCYSIWPSAKQDKREPLYRTIKLSHNIPICESSGPVSSYRWHSMTDEQFNAYVSLIESETEAFINDAEKKEGRPFTLFIAHHCFMNPVILCNINKRRVKEGKKAVPLIVFAHGTALKMFQNEARKEAEYPEKFTPMMKRLRIFEDTEQVQGVFAIAKAQKDTFREVFPNFPQGRVVVSPNGYNQEFFRLNKSLSVPPSQAQMDAVLSKFKPILYDSKAQFGDSDFKMPDRVPKGSYDRLIMVCGRLADWKRHDAVIRAAHTYSAMLRFAGLRPVTLIAGGGPNEQLEKLQKLAYQELGLKNDVYFIGPQSQQALSELNQVASVGCFPSKDEPFGLVIIECLACGTPVIGANSGGPKDFVNSKVGVLVEEDPNIETIAARVAVEVKKAVIEDWKSKMGVDCANHAKDNFSLGAQCGNMLKSIHGTMRVQGGAPGFDRAAAVQAGLDDDGSGAAGCFTCKLVRAGMVAVVIGTVAWVVLRRRSGKL